ncbi:MAG: ClpXP protease specificity-enhancing factor SspB [Myxococcota bacterium]
MTGDASKQQKREKMLELLDRGMVMIHLDPRAPGVIVPAQFRADPVLRLNVAWQFQLPALEVGEDSVYAVLSFQRQNFGCTLPWDAVFGLTMPDVEHEGMLWPESMPPELDPFFGPSAEQPVTPGGGVPVLTANRQAPRPQPARALKKASQGPGARPAVRGPARRGFALIQGGGDSEERDEDKSDATPPEPTPPRQRPSLKIVKD